jgi:hypothetical protein
MSKVLSKPSWIAASIAHALRRIFCWPKRKERKTDLLILRELA